MKMKLERIGYYALLIPHLNSLKEIAIEGLKHPHTDYQSDLMSNVINKNRITNGFIEDEKTRRKIIKKTEDFVQFHMTCYRISFFINSIISKFYKSQFF